MTDDERSILEILETYWRDSPFADDIKRQREIATMFSSGPNWRDLGPMDEAGIR